MCHLKIIPKLPDEKICQIGQCIVLPEKNLIILELNHMIAIEKVLRQNEKWTASVLSPHFMKCIQSYFKTSLTNQGSFEDCTYAFR